MPCVSPAGTRATAAASRTNCVFQPSPQLKVPASERSPYRLSNGTRRSLQPKRGSIMQSNSLPLQTTSNPSQRIDTQCASDHPGCRLTAQPRQCQATVNPPRPSPSVLCTLRNRPSPASQALSQVLYYVRHEINRWQRVDSLDEQLTRHYNFGFSRNHTASLFPLVFDSHTRKISTKPI